MTSQAPTFEKGYRKGYPYIRCRSCNNISYNSNDYQNEYCPFCHKFHSDLAIENKQANQNDNQNGNKIKNEAPKSAIYCEKCFQEAIPEYPGSKTYICPSRHRILVTGLIESELETKKEPKLKNKRKLEHTCPTCGKVAEVIKEQKVFGKLARTYTCGHMEFIMLLDHPEDRDAMWNKLYKFQQEGIEFLENADYTALLGDEMGLGKTIQSLMAYRYNYNELSPCLMICEAAKVYDWRKEFIEWVGDKYNEIRDEPIIHKSGTFGLCPGIKNHIISMALISKPKVLASILEYGFKLVIVDESHSFKNDEAERTIALFKIAKAIPRKIFLSGTPVMNKVEEFFPTLNMLRPSHFPSKANLISKCDRSDSGRVLGLSEWYRDRFFKMTSEYILRRKKKDVGIQLPKLSINKHSIYINNDKMFVNSYNAALDELEEILNKMSQGGSSQILGIMAKLRHICGIAKVKPTIDLVKEFLDSTDQEDKICIGVHHKLVMGFLEKGLKDFNPICISDEDGLTKANRIERFKRPENRVLIASILGAGQGLNIQFCKNAIQAEREWNPAKENQFYGRFHRIVKNEDGSIKEEFSEDDAVVIDILNATGSIDEFFDATVALKQEIVNTTDHEFSIDTEFMIELARKIVSKRLELGF